VSTGKLWEGRGAAWSGRVGIPGTLGSMHGCSARGVHDARQSVLLDPDPVLPVLQLLASSATVSARARRSHLDCKVKYSSVKVLPVNKNILSYLVK
jgi:hypothetical protein